MNKTQKDLTTESDWLEEYEGQLAVDVYQDNDFIVIKAPIAGVKPEDLEISITDEVVNIKGERKTQSELQEQKQPSLMYVHLL